MDSTDRALMEQIMGVQAPARVNPPASPQPVDEPVGNADETLAGILTVCGADKDAALARCDTAAQAFFDASKVSKIEAAKRDIDRTQHNKALWQEAQTMRSNLKTGVRAHFNARTVAAKVTKTTVVAADKRDDAQQALMAQFMASPEFMSMFAKFTESQEQK